MHYRFVLFPVAAAILACAGCWGGPAGVAPPDWDPDGMAQSAMELYDKNGDGILDQQELAAAPGLKAAAEAEAGSADLDGDGNLTQDEIRERIAYYEETELGITNYGMTLLLGKQQPLTGATVEVVPEPFLEGVLDVAKGTTRDNGFVLPSIEGEPVEGIRPGMYRVVVTSGSAPAKYTDSKTTPIGIEVTTPREGYAPPPPTFLLEN